MNDATYTPQAQYTRQTNGRKPGPAPDALSQYVFGKVQPQALPLEEAVLGALMIERDAMLHVCDILRPESFYLESHQLIYSAIVRLFSASQPVDILTVGEALRKSEDIDAAGGSHYLVELTSRVASAANVEYHARIIAQKAIQRDLIGLASRVTKDAYEDTTDGFDLLEMAERDLFVIASRLTRAGGPRQLSDLALSAYKQAEAAATTPGGLVGVPSGFRAIDELTGGWRPGDLIILAARPGMGKSALAADFAINAAKAGFPALVFSLEMSGESIAGRLMSAQARVNGTRLRNGKTTQADFQALAGALSTFDTLPLYIDATSSITVFEMLATARRYVRKHGIRLVVVDYLQLIGVARDQARGANRDQVIGEISRGLKRMAGELGLPVIALSQLSRAVETRGGSKRPMLSDLRESGNIEADADSVVFIYRPEYYSIETDEDGRSTAGKAEIIFAKHRNGALDTVDLEFVGELTHFEDVGTVPQFPATHPDTFTTSRREPDDNAPF